MIYDFPQDFRFGAATSAYQIEGGWDADGSGPSIWDTFVRRAGKIDQGHHGNVACNTYEQAESDIEIMRLLGLDAYRFSVSWPRVLPNGHGAVNEAGLDYYDRLVDGLLAASIEPYITLFHWDLPQALQDEMGGFADRRCAFHFADYAELIARRLGDRVKHWITLNEPWVHATLGHLRGIHAPGQINPWVFMRVAHNQMLAHGLATQRLRAVAPDASIGISLNLAPIYPQNDNEKNRRAADLADQFVNRLYLDALLKGQYPEPLWSKLRLFQPRIEPRDMELISQPLDFLGVNYYSRAFVQHAWYVPVYNARPAQIRRPTHAAHSKNGVQYSHMGWEVYPAGLFELLFRLKQEYNNIPVYITENGAAYDDKVEAGRVADPLRQQYIEQHLDNVAAAIKAGCDVRGYFVWSLLDNFEWSYGYSKRFGIVYVNFATQQRIIKDSGYWYQAFIKRVKAAEPSFG